jgi:hypothetical protein
MIRREPFPHPRWHALGVRNVVTAHPSTTFRITDFFNHEGHEEHEESDYNSLPDAHDSQPSNLLPGADLSHVSIAMLR